MGSNFINNVEDSSVRFWMEFAAGFLSVTGSSFMILNFLRFKAKRIHAKIILQLALSDLGWTSTVLLRSIFMLFGENYWSCGLRFLYQIFAVGSVFWTACFAFFLMYAVLQGDQTDLWEKKWKKKLVALHIICWIWSILFGIVMYILRDESTIEKGFCFPVIQYRLFIWGTYIIIAFLFIFITYLFVTRKFYLLRKHSPLKNRTRKSTLPFRLSLFLLAFIITWGPNVAWMIATYAKINNNVLHLLVDVIFNAQGFIDFLVYGFTTNSLRKRYTFINGVLLFFISPFIILPYFIWKFFIKRKKSKHEMIEGSNQSISTSTYSDHDQKQPLLSSSNNL